MRQPPMDPRPSSSPFPDQQEPIQNRRQAAYTQDNNSAYDKQAAGLSQIELMKTLHEFDKQNAVLRAQLDFATQNAQITAKIQNDTKALCFEILDKGADLTKKGATVATENNTALSSTISTVVAATRSYPKNEASVTHSTTSNPIIFPVLTTVPSAVNLSTQCVDSSALPPPINIPTSPPIAMSHQQHQHISNTPTPPIVISPCTPQPVITNHQFYPTIQGNIMYLLLSNTIGYYSIYSQSTLNLS